MDRHVVCRRCEALNLLVQTQRLPLCGKCKAPLLANSNPAVLQPSIEICRTTSETKSNSNFLHIALRHWPVTFVFLLVILGAVVSSFNVYVNDVDSDIYMSSLPIGKTRRAEAHVPVLQNVGHVSRNISIASNAFITINSEKGSSYFLKFLSINNDNSYFTIFVVGGTQIHIPVPVGSFSMRVASGYIWYGENILFGDTTQVSFSGTIFSWTSGTIWTIDLRKSVAGNMNLSPMRKEDF